MSVRWFARSRAARLIAVAVALLAVIGIVTVTAIFAYRYVSAPVAAVRPLPQAPTSVPASVTALPDSAVVLGAEFATLAKGLHAKMGVAVSAVGDGKTAMVFGDRQEGPAWSTIKVPLVIASYRAQNPRRVTEPMKAAITMSDNAAAESLWQQLGDPAIAARRVQQILQQAGDPTTVESRKLRPEFSAFGQTIWSLANQVKFIASAFCDSAYDPIFDLMGHIVRDQKWGIGNMAGARFKGGWGPSRSGNYLVRQIGVITGVGGKVAVAIAAQPGSGSFDDGIRDLDEVATWLTGHLGTLPAGQCRH